MKKRILFTQFSDRMLTPNSRFREYYRKAYSRMEGYHMPEHFMEIPLWIAKASAMLDERSYDKELHISQDVDGTIDHIDKGGYDYVMFSVMSSNEKQVQKVAGEVSTKIILGGYTDPNEFEGYGNVTYLGSLEGLGESMDVALGRPPDYGLFSGLRCIPRLTLSVGCTNECSYCTVPVGLEVLPDEEVMGQAESMEPLDFKLIFVDDKCFGQAENHRKISDVEGSVRVYNQDFMGFIVQTSPRIALREGFIEMLEDLKVKYLELGVETLDDRYLKAFRKPHKARHVEEVSERLKESGRIMMIPNLIMGIPGDPYEPTIDWVRRNLDIIPVVNVNYLSVHYDSMRGPAMFEPRMPEDSDQNSPKKSWLSKKDSESMEDAVSRIYELTA